MTMLKELKEVIEGISSIEEVKPNFPNPHHGTSGKWTKPKNKGSVSFYADNDPKSKVANDQTKSVGGGKTQITKIPCGGEARMRGGDVGCHSKVTVREVKGKKVDTDNWFYQRKNCYITKSGKVGKISCSDFLTKRAADRKKSLAKAK